MATQTPLILVRPLGFFIDSKEIRRSGLDYWEALDLTVAGNLEEVLAEHPRARCWFFTKTAARSYTSAVFQEKDLLVFGSETSGLPKALLQKNRKRSLKIPMWGPTRSLNLATAAGIVLYEAYRQIGKI